MQDNDYSSVSNENIEFPGFSEHEMKKVCGIDMIYSPKIDTYYIGEWEVQPLVPFVVLAMIFGTYCMSLYAFFSSIRVLGTIIVLCLTIFGSLMVTSYLRLINEGPGYLPFYWEFRDTIDMPFSPRILENSKLSPPNGILTTPNQYEWAHNGKKPRRCVLARSAKRYVVRPDHLCGWTGVWIGKKNYKLFILFNLYGFLYTLSFVLSAAHYALVVSPQLVTKFMIVYIGIAFLTVSFCLLTLTFFTSSSINACRGSTSWEQWNNYPNKYDKGCENNCIDVCGVNESCSWLVPKSPFSNLSLLDLAELYNGDDTNI